MEEAAYPPNDGAATTTPVQQESSSPPPPNGGDTVSAFKLTQSRYRRRGNAPDRIDDLDEMVDFNRCMTTTTPSSLSTGTAHLSDDPDGTSQMQEENDGDVVSGHYVDYQNLIQEVIVPDVDFTDRDYYKGPLFTLKGMSGFYYAPQALSKPLQRALALAAVSKYCESPHVTNMDSLNYSSQAAAAAVAVETENGDNNNHKSKQPLLLSSSSLWESWKRDTMEIQKGAAGSSTNGKTNKTKAHPIPPPAAAARRANKRSFQKLSWSTMGYHYDWNARSYNENVKSTMPIEIEQLAKLFATTSLLLERNKLNHQHQHQHPKEQSSSHTSAASSSQDDVMMSYTASACIVNYYNPKSLMGGHVDDLEEALDKPIVSLSIGRPAIFLLGGDTKEDDPVIPILVRPGDVMIMGGDSRLRYHGMARLLPLSACDRVCHNSSSSRSSPCSCNKNDTTYQVTIEDVISQSKQEATTTTTSAAVNDNSFQSLQEDKDEEMAMVDQFLTEFRINISARQVYH